MSIEDVAKEDPSKIHKIYVDPFSGPNVDDILKAPEHLGIPQHRSQLVWMMKSLYDCFIDKDCDMIEINPLIITKDGKVLAGDTKITVDDNAVFR
jgi:succinyl-CoA synthetase beta subunit